MSSQKQCHRLRRAFKWVDEVAEESVHLQERIAWLEHRPPWWKFWAMRKWRKEEPK